MQITAIQQKLGFSELGQAWCRSIPISLIFEDKSGP